MTPPEKMLNLNDLIKDRTARIHSILLYPGDMSESLRAFEINRNLEDIQYYNQQLRDEINRKPEESTVRWFLRKACGWD